MSKCIICGKEVNKTYGNSNLMGVYCRSCATENHYTNEQLIEYSQQKIADLEAKLAESEKNYKDARELGIEQFHSLKEIINSSQEEIDKLKQQLDEKEKELSEYVKIVDDLHKQLSDKCDFCDKTKDQDKISFAIAELEKVKENIHYLLSFDYNLLCKVNEQFDNQINELKGKVETILTHQHEDKGRS